MPAQEWDIEKITKMININLVGALNVLDIILPEFISGKRSFSFYGEFGRLPWIARGTWLDLPRRQSQT